MIQPKFISLLFDLSLSCDFRIFSPIQTTTLNVVKAINCVRVLCFMILDSMFREPLSISPFKFRKKFDWKCNPFTVQQTKCSVIDETLNLKAEYATISKRSRNCGRGGWQMTKGQWWKSDYQRKKKKEIFNITPFRMDVTSKHPRLNPKPRSEKTEPNSLRSDTTKILVKVKFIWTQNKAFGGC